MKNSIILGISIIVGCWLIKAGIESYAYKDRCVSVKGLAEREVKADKVIWPLSYSEVGNDMGLLYQEMERKKSTIVSFLTENGITDAEIMLSAPSVIDRKAQQWSSDNIQYRYQASSTITVSSYNVDRVLNLLQSQQELLKRGVAVGGYAYDVPATQFLFTKLNDLKPEMVEEATRNARQVAEKFAEDANCDLGSIRNAQQGQFSITEDATTPHIKKIRVVTTVDYYLK